MSPAVISLEHKRVQRIEPRTYLRQSACNRGVATRYDKLVANFMGIAKIATATIATWRR